MTFTIDINNIATGTEAKLHFDLLGFGDRNSLVILDAEYYLLLPSSRFEKPF